MLTFQIRPHLGGALLSMKLQYSSPVGMYRKSYCVDVSVGKALDKRESLVIPGN